MDDQLRSGQVNSLRAHPCFFAPFHARVPLMRIVGLIILLLFAALTAPANALEVDVKVSSVKMDIGLPFAPEHLLDGNPTTAWAGGGISGGPGQWIELIFAIPMRVNQLGIFNGNQAPDQFKEFRRIRSGRIVYDDGVETRFWLRDEPGEQIIECRRKPSRTIRIVIDKVFPKAEITGKMKVAVSEIKLYISLMGNPDDDPDAHPDPNHMASPPPVAPDRIVPEEIVALLKEFYVRQTSLSPDYADLFAEDVRDRNDFSFEVFKEMQRQQGTYKILRTAKVNTDGLGFEMVQLDGQFAEVRVFGAYRVKVGNLDTNLEEDSVFVVSKEADGWKIVELDGQEDLF